LIDQVLPLIEAALGKDGAVVAGKKPVDSDLDTLLANVSEIIDSSSTKDLDSLPIVVDYLQSWSSDGEMGNSREYFQQTSLEGWEGCLEERIAQTVLDTYADLKPLMWNSSTLGEQETQFEPPPRVAGEEPIRDPGDAGPFEELRDSLQIAVEASKPINPAAEVIETKNAIPKQPAIEYDIVMPEPDEEPPAPRPISRTDAPTAGETENHTVKRTYQNLFSDLRQKKQA
jgi:hypothetical protein